MAARQHFVSPCRSPDKLGQDNFDRIMEKQAEGDGEWNVNIPFYAFA